MSEVANIQVPEHGAPPQWQEARGRLEAYLRALNLASPEQHRQIVAMVLKQGAENPQEEPLALVMSEFQSLSDGWFKQASPARQPPAPGFVSYLAIDGGRKWPEAFLAEEIPADLRLALQRCELRAAPDLKVSRMVPLPFDNVLQDLNLPTALTQLTKDLPPSLVAKVVALVMSGLALLSGNRLR